MNCHFTKNIQAKIQIRTGPDHQTVRLIVDHLHFDADEYDPGHILSVSGAFTDSSNKSETSSIQTMLTLKYPDTQWDSLVYVDNILYNGIINKADVEYNSDHARMNLIMYVLNVFDTTTHHQLHGLQHV